MHAPGQPHVSCCVSCIVLHCAHLCCTTHHSAALPCTALPLTERLKFLESELKEHRQLLASMTQQRDSLQEDMWQMKAAKKQSDEVRATIMVLLTYGGSTDKTAAN